MADPPTHPKLQQLFDQHSGLILAIFLVIIIVAVGSYSWFIPKPIPSQINNYADCVTSPGSRIQETYPEQCVTQDGQTFINTDTIISPTPSPSPSAAPTP